MEGAEHPVHWMSVEPSSARITVNSVYFERDVGAASGCTGDPAEMPEPVLN
jgi:hypothetical protein